MNYAYRAKKVIAHQIDALENMYVMIDKDKSTYCQIIHHLMDIAKDQEFNRRIIITGIGKNANLATKASETFASLGIPSMYLNSCHYAHGDAGFIGPNDVVIHVSRSGKTEEMLFAAKHLRQIRPGVRQILLHCNPELNSGVLSNFDISFCTGKAIEADTNALAPTTSTTLLLSLLDTIAINLSDHIGFSRKNFLAYHPGGALGAMLKAEQ